MNMIFRFAVYSCSNATCGMTMNVKFKLMNKGELMRKPRVLLLSEGFGTGHTRPPTRSQAALRKSVHMCIAGSLSWANF